MRPDCLYWLKATRLLAKLTLCIASCPASPARSTPHLRGMKREE